MLMARYPMIKEQRADIEREFCKAIALAQARHTYSFLCVCNDNSEEKLDVRAKKVRILTPSIPDIDLNRYLCPECETRLRVNHDCKKCGQLIDWGFMTAD